MPADRLHRPARAVGSEPGQLAAAPAHPSAPHDGAAAAVPPHGVSAPDIVAPHDAVAHTVSLDQIAALAPTADGPPAFHLPAPDPHEPPAASIPLIHVTLATIADTPGTVPFQDSLFPALSLGQPTDLFTPSPVLQPPFQRPFPEDHTLLVLPAGATHGPPDSTIVSGGAGDSLQIGGATA